MNQKIILSILAAVSAIICSSCADYTSAAYSNTSNPSQYPVAKPMVNPNTKQVIKDHYVSPYRPYNPIVAKGFRSGQLAGDPSTMKTDPATGKPIQDTIKIFRLP